MTIADLRTILSAALDGQAVIYGENSTLSSADNTAVTDELAAVLETVNPNHNYPPTNK